MDDLLKPCPFCGAKDIRVCGAKDSPLSIEHQPSKGRGWAEYWSIVCEGCTAEGARKGARAEAIAAWNRRYD